MKHIFILLVSTIITCSCCGFVSIEPTDNRTDCNNIENISQEIQKNEEIKNHAHDMANAARELGYQENHYIIQEAQDLWMQADQQLELLHHHYQYLCQAKKKKDFPEAFTIWQFFKQQGFSDEVVAGILGNIMSECGGNTLSLHPNVKNNSYYGICQWNKAYDEVWEQDLLFQCEFLLQTLSYEFNTFGYAYKNNFRYEDFLLLTNPKEVALAFAKCYERCSPKSYNKRQNNAIVAYEYFTIGKNIL